MFLTHIVVRHKYIPNFHSGIECERIISLISYKWLKFRNFILWCGLINLHPQLISSKTHNNSITQIDSVWLFKFFSENHRLYIKPWFLWLVLRITGRMWNHGSLDYCWELRVVYKTKVPLTSVENHGLYIKSWFLSLVLRTTGCI
jgi:hypothetical protein